MSTGPLLKPVEPPAPPPTLGQRVSEVWSPYQPERLESGGLKPVRVEESSIRKTASLWLLIAMALFMAWAFNAPIDAGVSVPGTVVVLGNRKAVQHPKGGVIQSILVREGATVRQGDLLIKMNPLNTEADLTSVALQYINLLATESRLQSERDGRADIAWKAELERRGRDARAAEAQLIQGQLFRSRLDDLRGQEEIFKEQIAGLQAQGEGMRGVLRARQQQLVVLTEEAKNNRELAEEGYVPRSKANEVARSLSELTASIANTSAELAKTATAIAATKLQMTQLRTNHLKEIDTQLSETQKSREALQSKVESLRFELDLTELRAPVGGTVVGVKVFTVGGVVQPGQLLMEVVPSDERLVVEAKVPPNLIDKVRVGLEADMRFTAFNITTTPVIPGVVRIVGADRIKAEADRDEHYLSTVEVTPEGRKLLGTNAVQPGMPVDVIIKTGERTFVSYFVKPITDRFARALKEQ